jgi:thioredoxin 1
VYSRFLALAAVCAASCAASFLLPATVHADIVWETNYDQARAKSIATGKPLFVDVYTDWCGWCKKLDSTVYPDPRVQQMAGSFVMLRLNAEGGGASFARTMQVKSYPSLFFATAQGVQVARIGYVEPAYFASFMQETLRRNGPIRAQRAARPNKAKISKTKRRSSAVVMSRRNWKKLPELRPVANRSGYGGAFVLGDGGVVALEAPVKKNSKSKSAR